MRDDITLHYSTPDTALSSAAADLVGSVRREIDDPTIAAIYEYPRPDGRPCMAVARYESPDGRRKTIRPLTHSDGAWRPGGLPEEDRPPYRAPSLVSLGTDRTVFLVEGEKCADAIVALGLPATTSIGGSGGARRTDWSLLAGRDVVVLPDRDDAGERYLADVAACLADLHPPAKVRVWRVEPLDGSPPPKGYDIADLLAEVEATESDADTRREWVEGMAERHAQPYVRPAPASDPDAPPPILTAGELLAACPDLRPSLIHGLLRQGETMNIIAAPKVGKSWLVLDMALSIATGGKWLGRFSCERGRVLIVDNELHRETCAKRLGQVANARGLTPRSFVESLHVWPTRGQGMDITKLSKLLASMPRETYAAIVIDAFYRSLPRDCDENDNGHMRDVYNAIDAIAEQTGAAIVLVHHSSKGDQSGKAVTDVGSGAGAQSRAADAHLILRAHEDDDAAVAEAVVRSSSPIEPIGLRWAFPCWAWDEFMDTSRLRKAGSAKSDDPKPDRSPEAFVKLFIGATPKTKAVVVADAIGAGWPDRIAKGAIAQAVDRGLAYEWKSGHKSVLCDRPTELFESLPDNKHKTEQSRKT
jgi:AAA domain